MSIPFSGILEIDSKRFGFVRTVSHGIRLSRMDPYVSSSVIAKYRLRPGVLIEGNAEPKSKKSPEVGTIERINNLSPAAWSKVKEFSHHEVVSPSEMLHLEGPESNVSMRIVDLFCPVGKGQRALIVSPPKAGKTMLMQQLAHAISVNNPEIDLLVLASSSLGQAHVARTDYRRATEVLAETLALLEGPLLRERFGQGTLPAVLARLNQIRGLVELGRFPEAIDRGEEALRIAL